MLAMKDIAMAERLVTLTTGEIAKYLNVNYITVIRWINKGRLKAHKLPARGDRRVEIHDFLEFLRKNDLPIPDDLKPYLRRILIVDDDVALTQVMLRILEESGFEVKIGHDGFSAGQLLGIFQPVVMILDLKMPGLDGMQVLERLRSDESPSPVRVLVVSGASKRELDAAIAAGADDILSKPFMNDVFLGKVAALAGLSLPQININNEFRNTAE